MQEFC